MPSVIIVVILLYSLMSNLTAINMWWMALGEWQWKVWLINWCSWCDNQYLKILFLFVMLEGFFKLWTGASLNVLRAVLMTLSQVRFKWSADKNESLILVIYLTQIAFYEQTKQILLGTRYFEDNVITHFSASIIAVSGECTPLDMPLMYLMMWFSNQYLCSCFHWLSLSLSLSNHRV